MFALFALVFVLVMIEEVKNPIQVQPVDLHVLIGN
jgi:hypothetical protein